MTTMSPKRLAQKRRYNKSEKGKAANRRYAQSPKGKAFYSSEAMKAYHKRYAQSPKGKASMKRYQHSAKFKAAQKRYLQSEKGKSASRLRYKRRYSRNPNPFKSIKAVRQAIVHGKLQPLCRLRCHYCREQAEQYHHYLGHEPEHWLDVVPVCNKCHVKSRSHDPTEN